MSTANKKKEKKKNPANRGNYPKVNAGPESADKGKVSSFFV